MRRTILVFQLALGATTVVGQDLPGEYRRHYDWGSVGAYDQPGMQLTLRPDGDFAVKIMGDVSTDPSREMKIGVAGTASGHWERAANEVLLVPRMVSGCLEKGHVMAFTVVDWDGRPALVRKEVATQAKGGRVPFTQLLLPERTATTHGESKADLWRNGQRQWQAIAAGLSGEQDIDVRPFIGRTVAIEGDRITPRFDGEPLVVRVSQIQCRVRNNIDGTRTANSWVAGIVRVQIVGTVLTIDVVAKAVEIQPISAGIVSAR